MQFGELRPEDMEPVAELFRATGADMGEAGERPLVLGLAAREQPGAPIVGAILVRDDPQQGYINCLAVVPEHADSELPRQLIAKAMSKLYTRGVRRCHLIPNASGDASQFWDLLRWQALRSQSA